jgi:hypothetical protein
MKAKDLKRILAKIPDDFEVILSRDGNFHSPLSTYFCCVYTSENEDVGKVRSKQSAEEMENAITLCPSK